jgi:hypothetical protein
VTTRAPSTVRARPGALRAVSRRHDPAERQAERAAEVVARGGSVAGWAFARVPASAGSPVQRQEVAKEKTDEEKKQEALSKVAEAAVETPQAKALKDKVLADPLVKSVKDAVTSPAGLATTGVLAAGGVAALGAAKKPLPFQPPAIPLDKITPGLSAQVKLEGPVNAPSFVGLTISYKEQGPKSKKTPESDKVAADIARLKAEQELFKPESQKKAEKQQEDELVQAWIRSQSGLPGLQIPLKGSLPRARPEDAQKKEDEGKAPVQPAPASPSAAMPASAQVDDALATPGRALDARTRRAMSARFGYDFSGVRVHDDARAAATAASIDAAAFTVGEHLVFAPGRYDPSSRDGRRLLAHELSHVVQHAGGRAAGGTARPSGRPLDPRERAYFEPRLGADLGRVRIHADSAAADSAAGLGARAYTSGSDVVFGRGEYRPETPRGRWLLAHELAHAAQPEQPGGADGRSAVEHDATDAATTAVRGGRARVRARRRTGAVHLFGEPDHVPSLTFVSTHESSHPGFLAQAVHYHRIWGLSPQRFDSMQQLLATLARDTGAIPRLRIVSHADFDNLFTPLFDGGTAGITEEDLNAFAESDVVGLRRRLGPPLIRDTALRSRIVDGVRGANPAALRPFGLEQPGSTPSAPVEELIEASVDLLAVRTATGGLPADQRATLDAGLSAELDGLRTQLQAAPPTGAGVTEAQAQALQNAITGVTGVTFTLPALPAARVAGIRHATAALAHGFRTNLEAVRARLPATSWIDIRGCRVGQRPAYLAAVARFFGTARAKPHVSGPDLFQSYPRLGFRTVLDRNIARQARDSDVSAALDHWSSVTGVHARFMWWLSFLGSVLREEAARESAPAASPLMPPSLAGGLRLRVDPLTIGLSDPSLVPLPPLPEPTLTLPRRPSPGLGAGTLRNPLVDVARREIPRLTAPDGELRYYLDSGLPLPVQQAANVQNVFLLLKAGLERDAMDAWLGSQWEPAAPGLAALRAGRWQSDEAREVEAVSDLDERRRTRAMFVSPDPRYAEHIKTT